MELRRFEEAVDCYQQSLGIKRETGDRYGEGLTLSNLGNAYQEMQQPAREWSAGARRPRPCAMPVTRRKPRAWSNWLRALSLRPGAVG